MTTLRDEDMITVDTSPGDPGRDVDGSDGSGSDSGNDGGRSDDA